MTSNEMNNINSQLLLCSASSHSDGRTGELCAHFPLVFKRITLASDMVVSGNDSIEFVVNETAFLCLKQRQKRVESLYNVTVTSDSLEGELRWVKVNGDEKLRMKAKVRNRIIVFCNIIGVICSWYIYLTNRQSPLFTRIIHVC